MEQEGFFDGRSTVTPHLLNGQVARPSIWRYGFEARWGDLTIDGNECSPSSGDNSSGAITARGCDRRGRPQARAVIEQLVSFVQKERTGDS